MAYLFMNVKDYINTSRVKQQSQRFGIHSAKKDSFDADKI
jgi:hypothetical protein